MTAPANPLKNGELEDFGHVGNPSKHCAVANASDVDLTDSSHLGAPSIAIYVGTGGNIELTDSFGTSCTYKNVPSGTYVVGIFVGVVGAGTTAQDMIAVGK